MKLNVHILFDALASFLPRLAADDSIDMNLMGVRKLPTDAAACSPDYIYLADVSRIQNLEAAGLSLIILGDVDHALLQERQWKSIIIASIPDFQMLYEHVQSVFDHYNKWDDDLADSIISGEPVQKQMEICARVLDNLIALFDTSGVLIAKAGPIPEDYKGTVWESVLDKGYFTKEYLPQKYRSMESEFIKAHKPLISPPMNDAKYVQRSIVAVLIRKGIPLAVIGILNILKKVTPGQQSLVWHFQQRLENAAHQDFFFSPNGYSFLINQLLCGAAVDPQRLSYFLNFMHWSADDRYYLLRFTLQVDTGVTEANSQYYVFHIQQALPDAYIFAFENAIFAIHHQRKEPAPPAELRKKLLPFLKKEDLHVGVSMEHTGYQFLYSAKLQSVAASEFGRKKYPDTVFFLFQHIYAEYMLDVLGSKQNALYYCHPTIQKMMDGGKPRDANLIHTLWVYLQSGQNVAATAVALRVHRNTLLGRLSSLEGIFNIRFNALDENTLQILYFSCFIAEKLTKPLTP
jgi:hypothetical protein